MIFWLLLIVSTYKEISCPIKTGFKFLWTKEVCHFFCLKQWMAIIIQERYNNACRDETAQDNTRHKGHLSYDNNQSNNNI